MKHIGFKHQRENKQNSDKCTCRSNGGNKGVSININRFHRSLSKIIRFSPQGIDNFIRFWLFCLVPLVYLLPKTFTFYDILMLALRVPDDGYYRPASCVLDLTSTSLF